MSDTIITVKHDLVTVLYLNRPQTLNCFNNELLETLAETLKKLDADPGVRCVVITGSGRGFCAGGDGLKIFWWKWFDFYVFTGRIRRPTTSGGPIFRCTTKDGGERRAKGLQSRPLDSGFLYGGYEGRRTCVLRIRIGAIYAI